MQSDSRCSYRSNVRSDYPAAGPDCQEPPEMGILCAQTLFFCWLFLECFQTKGSCWLWPGRFGCRCVSWLWQASLLGTTLVNEAFGTTTPSQQQHHHHPYDHHHHYHHRRHHHRHRFYYCLLAVSFSQVRLQWLGRVDNSNNTVMSDNDRIAQAKHAMI